MPSRCYNWKLTLSSQQVTLRGKKSTSSNFFIILKQVSWGGGGGNIQNGTHPCNILSAYPLVLHKLIHSLLANFKRWQQSYHTGDWTCKCAWCKTHPNPLTNTGKSIDNKQLYAYPTWENPHQHLFCKPGHGCCLEHIFNTFTHS